MIVNKQNLNSIYVNVKAIFTKRAEEATPLYPQISTKISSSTKTTDYPFLGYFPSLREWIGERVIKSLTTYKFSIENRKFESTISISREDIEDDNIGMVKSMVSDMAEAAAHHPDELLFELIKNGFHNKCYDGKPFFSDKHPVVIGTNESFVSNIQVPTTTADEKPMWLLLDTTRPINPFIWQERIPYQVQQLTSSDDTGTFINDEYYYGVRGRGNMGYGFWQMAFASKKELTTENFNDLYNRMSSQKNDAGRPLRVKPTILLTGVKNREAAFNIAKAQTLDNMKPNPNYGLVEVIVTPFLD
ncbi:Mu-like prophage major head subunit gpT family protein [Klebsiella sp. WP8-S18-ESBL-06]|uniref:Mu-like prophage major head subunit gpT family protein n=1 Tax=Klebsiella sp. WP8-S18-ESBL-06 TaxID=2675726 RepID=UPI0015DC22B6|nr:Mu-like prophage major head subunit gpT family protein [Klebsiella sp. WP8-S18-ESBL-06]BBT70549.1 head protein [Klebsiella sp. WP8-S18-ESBL-06]